jgi:hypothetical protein
MPSDFVSNNVLDKIDMFTSDLPIVQQRDKFAHTVLEFLQQGVILVNCRIVIVSNLSQPVSIPIVNPLKSVQY